MTLPSLHLTPEARDRIRTEIERAGGREVCFLGEVGPDREIRSVRAVARGNHEAVLAAARDAPVGSVLLHNHPSGELEPSEADLRVAERLHHLGLGTGIVDNAGDRLYVVVEPPVPKRRRPLPLDHLASFLEPDGPLSELHPRYEPREGQVTMLRFVGEGYEEGGIRVVEAGTGTGKSLAYLLPAAAWAMVNDERTVVSTNTINLQEQLVSKDLPLVSRILSRGGGAGGSTPGESAPEGGVPAQERLTWALVKGRGNYVSIRRARLAAEGQTALFERGKEGELRAVLDWIGETDDGSLSDLPFTPSDEVWEEVRSDGDICLRTQCPHFRECFYQRSRQAAVSAKLLVVNHHLLFSDLAVRRASGKATGTAVLPPYRRVILDEAHNVEDAATDHLGFQVTRAGIGRALSRLERRGKGVLAAVQDALRPDRDAEGRAAPAAEGLGAAAEIRRRIEERVRPSVNRARGLAAIFFDALDPMVPPRGQGARRLGCPPLPSPLEDPELAEAHRAVVAEMRVLARELGELARRLELDEALPLDLIGRILDLRSIERRIETAAVALRAVLEIPAEPDGLVRWIERTGSRRRGERNVALGAAPVEVGPLLRESFFEGVESAVLTSATLTTRGRFDFVRGRLGLDDSASELLIPSPFDYRRQTLLAVPTDLPPAEGPSGPFEEATAQAVGTLTAIADGGIFALFTSHGSLRRVAGLMREAGVEEERPLLVHGESPRSRLVEEFVRSGRALLLGTASFWEGVDVPGDPLRGLVIQRLPFRVPTEPVTEARGEAIEHRGGDAFQQYLLPQAALRLKQGFGRLVRSREDRGVVLLLDDRILRKRYGRYLRDSLPEATLAKGPWAEIEMRLKSFYRAG